MTKRKYSPWTLLRRRLNPLIEELHRATPWRISDHPSASQWLESIPWIDLWWCDEVCVSICSEPPSLPLCLFSSIPVEAGVDLGSEEWQLRMAQQLIHRMLFAVDLSEKMSQTWRKEFHLTGDYAHDSKEILIHAWRTNAPLVWAREMGELYLEGDSVS